jgi:hypothetical protein
VGVSVVAVVDVAVVDVAENLELDILYIGLLVISYWLFVVLNRFDLK